MTLVNHISIRVPWHDDQWRGTVCKKPRDNGACVVLPQIAEEKREEVEMCVAGQRFDAIEEAALPPCLKERASFMAPFTLRRKLAHPYKHLDSAAHRDLQTMALQQPPFSAACIPFKWMRREFADDIAKGWRLDYDPAREPTEPNWMVENGWVQNGRNQRAMLDGFFSTIRKDHSLCFFYAKQTPFSDDPRRVLVGVGRVEEIGKPLQYDREGKPADSDTSYVWDIVISHSIRAEVGNGGFLMPYAELAAAQDEGADVDWTRCLAFSPADRLSEFSYAAEHVTADGAISALLECRFALEAAKEVLKQADGVARALRWIDARISELWKLRGAYPGLGAALSAFGVQHANFLALHLAEHLSPNDDPWPLVNKAMCEPASLPSTLAKLVTGDLTEQWKSLKASRLELLKLLARFALTNEQAARFYIRAERDAAELHYDDSQLLENPYLFYEGDRFSIPPSEETRLERIRLETIDRGAYLSALEDSLATSPCVPASPSVIDNNARDTAAHSDSPA
ncbi:hypothetical protein [Burkholderia pseudomallei]|uniref:hypothetical protein n=1 Tax=Burkholderia pseudomallei TaxID=28450 RepID=UPI001AD70ED1|nr:hypothetical protein [Burkholderia pseudomallei]MBO7749310.1 hypothetical protein [Burkholderia pseudomallei]